MPFFFFLGGGKTPKGHFTPEAKGRNAPNKQYQVKNLWFGKFWFKCADYLTYKNVILKRCREIWEISAGPPCRVCQSTVVCAGKNPGGESWQWVLWGPVKAAWYTHHYWQSGVYCTPILAVLRVPMYGSSGVYNRHLDCSNSDQAGPICILLSFISFLFRIWYTTPPNQKRGNLTLVWNWLCIRQTLGCSKWNIQRV